MKTELIFCVGFIMQTLGTLSILRIHQKWLRKNSQEIVEIYDHLIELVQLMRVRKASMEIQKK